MPRPAIHRLLPWLASLALALPTSVSAQPAEATLAVLDFDLIEEHVEPGQAADMRRRVLRMEEMLAQGWPNGGCTVWSSLARHARVSRNCVGSRNTCIVAAPVRSRWAGQWGRSTSSPAGCRR